MLAVEIENIIKDIQPHYTKLNSRYSKSYLSGSIWYVGDDLTIWWKRCNTIRYFRYHLNKLLVILEIIINDLKTQLLYNVESFN